MMGQRTIETDAAMRHLQEHGYAVIESVLSDDELAVVRQSVAEMMTAERESPFDPGDGPAHDDDEAMAAYLKKAYQIDDGELARVLKRIRHSRSENHGTPWPVAAAEVNHNFLHIPLLLNGGRSQRSYNLPAKLPEMSAGLIEHSTLLPLLESVLSADFILSDMSATSIGAGTDGGYWHVDAPLTMLPEPLPDVVLAVQTIWMLDDFTEENGATRVVPGSHRSLKKPQWGYQALDDEIALTAPAGSLALWLSHTWHRVGANRTDRPRRAIIGYYSQSWVKPFSDYTRSMPPETLEHYSDRSRYLLGWSAFAPTRG